MAQIECEIRRLAAWVEDATKSSALRSTRKQGRRALGRLLQIALAGAKDTARLDKLEEYLMPDAWFAASVGEVRLDWGDHVPMSLRELVDDLDAEIERAAAHQAELEDDDG